MMVILCVDDAGGMTFNSRRVSRDREVCADVARLTRGARLYMSEYSAKLFSDTEADIFVSESFLDEAGAGDYCFVEDRALLPYVDAIERVIIYRWNRSYPSETRFDIDLVAHGFKICSSLDMAGYSHEKITKEIYAR